MLGDHARELRDARRARAQHPESRSVLAYEIAALAALGRVDDLRTILNEALGYPPRPSWGHAWEAAVAGGELRTHGNIEAANEFLQLALDRLRAHVPDSTVSSDHRYNLARTLYWLGKWDDARRMFADLAAADPEDVSFSGQLAAVYARLGRGAEATPIDERFAALDSLNTNGYRTYWRARIAAVSGDADRAVALLHQAFNRGYEYNIFLHRNIDFESLRDHPGFEEFMRPKG